MRYTVQWKRLGEWLFRKEKDCVGHQYQPHPLDRMNIKFADGSVKEIPKWSECQCVFGVDYHAAMIASMSEQAGQQIPVKAL